MLNYLDHHVHTEFSPDSEATMREYLEQGMKKIMFTDHVDIGSPDSMFVEVIDYDEYFKIIKKLQKEYDVEILVGVEMGYQKEYRNEIEAFVKRYPFDFVIASIHFGDGMDFYSGEFFKGKTQREAYERYFEIVEDMVENFESFDVVGHMDYITRYGGFNRKYYEYLEYKVIIEKILKKIIKKGKGIEINTSGMRNELKVFHPKKEIVERFWGLGGKIITLGSDAHIVSDFSFYFEESVQMLRDSGVEYITEFEKRKKKKIIINSL